MPHNPPVRALNVLKVLPTRHLVPTVHLHRHVTHLDVLSMHMFCLAHLL